MAQNLLASLTVSGIVERTHRARTLRVTPRFMAHAEGTSGRMQTLGIQGAPVDVLVSALRGWDEFHGDAHRCAVFLEQVLAERDQLGSLQPVFPAIESFVAAA